MQQLKIDPELRDLLPPLTDEEYKKLEINILENGFDKNFPIMEWNGFIVDGHNRYNICKKHNITDYTVGTLAYKTKEEVMEWMLDIQLGRRNLSPIQRISVAEKYRPIYEKQARENQGRRTDLINDFVPNLAQSKSDNRVNTKLANVANVGKETYRMGKKILDSNNKEVKDAVLSGDMSINAGYNKIREDEKQKENKKSKDINSNGNSQKAKINQKINDIKVSDEVKKICEDLKIEKTKEDRESSWDYKISIIACMNADFKRFYTGFVSTLKEMENHVTKRELDECIENAENMVEKMLLAIEIAKNTILKTEE